MILFGCAGPTESTLNRDRSPALHQYGTGPVETALVTSRITAKTVAAVSEEVLAGMNFEIDKIDPNTGYIKTKPLPGAQFFEFWRNDNIGTQNQLLANLHSIRRTVEIELASSGIDCKVQLQRLAMPERLPASTTSTSSARAYAMFTLSSPAMQTLQLTAKQQKDAEWIDLGRDTALENEIVRRIKSKILTSE